MAAVSHKAAAYGCTPNDKNFEDYKLFAGDNVEVDCGASTPKTVYLSIAQGFGPRQAKEPYVNIRPRGKPTVVTRTGVRAFRQIVVTLKELGPNTYKCLQDPEDANQDMMDVVDDSNEDEDEFPEYGKEFAEEGDEELGNGTRAEATKYLRKLKTAHLAYLDDVDTEALPGVKDFIPLVYIGDDDEADED